MQGLLFLLFLLLGFAFFLSCLTYCYSYSGLWEQCTSMMKEKIDDQKDFQKNLKLLWRVHENLTFCLESLGLWGATQVSAIFSDSVTVTCWISPSSILVDHTLFLLKLWINPGLWSTYTYSFLQFQYMVLSVLCFLPTCELTSFFVFMCKAVHVLSSDGRFELSEIIETNDKANDKSTDLYLTQAASVFPSDIMTGMNYVLNLLHKLVPYLPTETYLYFVMCISGILFIWVGSSRRMLKKSRTNAPSGVIPFWVRIQWISGLHLAGLRTMKDAIFHRYRNVQLRLWTNRLWDNVGFKNYHESHILM